MHGSLLPYGDNTISPNEIKKSVASLPDGLEIKKSGIDGAGLGIFTTQVFTVGATFGPYTGEKVRPDIPKEDMDTSYMWEVIFSHPLSFACNCWETIGKSPEKMLLEKIPEKNLEFFMPSPSPSPSQKKHPGKLLSWPC